MVCDHDTTATAEDRTVRHVILEHLVRIASINDTKLTTVDIDIGTAAILSDGFIASFAVAIEVTLTNGTQVTATEHVTHHVTAVDVDVGIAIHLTTGVGVLAVVLALTFTATIDGVTDKALSHGDVRITVDVAVFTTAVNGTSDAGLRQVVLIVGWSSVAVDVNVDVCLVDIGEVGFHILRSSHTLTTAVDVAIVLVGVLTFDTDTTAGDIHGSYTRVVFVNELIRPANGERSGRIGVFDGVVDGTHRGHLTTTINATHHPTTFHVDGGVALHDTCQRVVGIRCIVVVAVVHIGTATGAEHVTAVFIGLGCGVVMVTDVTAIDIDGSIGVDVTIFTGAIHRTVHQACT